MHSIDPNKPNAYNSKGDLVVTFDEIVAVMARHFKHHPLDTVVQGVRSILTEFEGGRVKNCSSARITPNTVTA